MMDDNRIDTITAPEQLFDTELLLDVFDDENPPEEQARIVSVMSIKARTLGVYKEFTTTIKAFQKAQQKLANEYQRINAKQNGGMILDFASDGKPLATIDNFVQVIENDSKFDNLRFNLLTESPEKIIDGKAERWTDADDAELRRYIEKKYKFHSAQKSDDALRLVLKGRQYHPIRQLINHFEWDGVSRINTFLTKWTKCDDNEYTREVSRLIFSGGIHRLYNPGCKFDDMAVFIGTRQGEGKSTLIRWLALDDKYFTEVSEFDGQRGIEALEGAWICEVGEMLAMVKAQQQEAVKAYLTRINDKYRKPFDKRVTEHPRQCIFIGTTNKAQFLTDKTGNRRFYPVVVHQSGYDLFEHEEEIKANIKQCWAEALHLFKQKKLPPYADRKLIDVIRKEQANAVEDDYRIGMITEYLNGKSEVCVLQIWQHALNMGEFSKPTKKDSQEIGLIMQNLENWKKQPYPKTFAGFGSQRWWRKEGCADIDSFDDIDI